VPLRVADSVPVADDVAVDVDVALTGRVTG
jgi:hypothetical protein